MLHEHIELLRIQVSESAKKIDQSDSLIADFKQQSIILNQTPSSAPISDELKFYLLNLGVKGLLVIGDIGITYCNIQYLHTTTFIKVLAKSAVFLDDVINFNVKNLISKFLYKKEHFSTNFFSTDFYDHNIIYQIILSENNTFCQILVSEKGVNKFIPLCQYINQQLLSNSDKIVLTNDIIDTTSSII